MRGRYARDTLFLAAGAPDYDTWPDVPKCAGMDPEWWFANSYTSTQNDAAKAICGGCPVRTECLEHQLQVPGTDDYGIWGGTTPQERRQIRRERGWTGRRSEWRAA